MSKSLILAMCLCFMGGGLTAGLVGITWFDEIRQAYRDMLKTPSPDPAVTFSKTMFEAIPSHYISEAGPQLRLSFENNVQKPGDIAAWRSMVLDAYDYNYADISGAYSGSSPVLLGTLSRQAHILEKYSLVSSDSDIILYYKIIPSEPRACTVVISPGSGHQGARDVAGIASPISKFYYQDAIGVTVAEQTGCEVIVPELRGWGERQTEFEYCNDVVTEYELLTCSHNILDSTLYRIGIDLGEKSVRDIAEILVHEYDDSRAWATGGLFSGAGMGLTMALGNMDKFDAVFLASVILRESEFPAYAIGITHTVMQDDAADRALLFAPSPMYMSFGQNEQYEFKIEAQRGITKEYMQNAYYIMGYPENFHYTVHNGGHAYDPDSLVGFLNKYL